MVEHLPLTTKNTYNNATNTSATTSSTFPFTQYYSAVTSMPHTLTSDAHDLLDTLAYSHKEPLYEMPYAPTAYPS